jgi:hypothetical protein
MRSSADGRTVSSSLRSFAFVLERGPATRRIRTLGPQWEIADSEAEHPVRCSASVVPASAPSILPERLAGTLASRSESPSRPLSLCFLVALPIASVGLDLFLAQLR